MITREADYALRVVLRLVQQGATNPTQAVSSAEIAEAMGIPYRFLRKIVRRLVGGGLVRSRRGQGGGIYLARAPEGLSLYDVLQVMDPSGKSINACTPGGPGCPREDHCPLSAEMKKIQRGIDRALRDTHFGDCVEVERVLDGGVSAET
ncbi:RrF2 family transcriptional regulator [Kiritimatiella glycovorans]|uniref:Rrf2 family transcriptional regulator n=1 Tax=Kiritimatiella glycovorans TaxID=1307763 RepID=A0A0G3EIW0_9BACT|nr:Rrf2 family transcriptional regulator [Kiritimatiella glycovorans]AKJ64770.1 Rrf2 family transcriptional regulator [Kiritimatiella glycovorans]